MRRPLPSSQTPLTFTRRPWPHGGPSSPTSTHSPPRFPIFFSPHSGSPSQTSVHTSPHFPFSIFFTFVSCVPQPAWRAWETAAFVISFILSQSHGTSLFPLSLSAFVSAAQRLAGVGIGSTTEKYNGTQRLHVQKAPGFTVDRDT